MYIESYTNTIQIPYNTIKYHQNKIPRSVNVASSLRHGWDNSRAATLDLFWICGVNKAFNICSHLLTIAYYRHRAESKQIFQPPFMSSYSRKRPQTYVVVGICRSTQSEILKSPVTRRLSAQKQLPWRSGAAECGVHVFASRLSTSFDIR